MTTSTMLIKQLREATYASYLDCAKTLAAFDGDYDQALEQLRAVGLDKAEKKAERETPEGLIVLAGEGARVCVLELDCETDFVARTQDFKQFAHHLAGQMLADPALSDLDRVLAAAFVGAPGQTVALAIKALAGRLGENVTLGRVARYEAGPGRQVEGYLHVGALEGYAEGEGRLGVLVEVQAEGAADTAAVQAVAHDLALHIASGAPRYLAPETIPAEDMAEKRTELDAQLAAEHKPEALQAKILEGRLHKFYQETCLLSQPFLKDDSLSVAAWLQQQSEAIGAAVRVVRFTRFELGG